MKRKLDLFADNTREKKEDTLSYITGKISRYFKEDENTDVFDRDELLFIKVVQDAHALMTDMTHKANINEVSNTLSKMHNIDKQQCVLAIKVADNIFNTQTSAQKHYLKLMLIKSLENKMKKCEEEKDHKYWLKYYNEYIKLTGLDQAEAPDFNGMFETININFMPTPELLNSYSVGDAEIIESTLKRIEARERQRAFGIGE